VLTSRSQLVVQPSARSAIHDEWRASEMAPRFTNPIERAIIPVILEGKSDATGADRIAG
jgi:hypothetical protein